MALHTWLIYLTAVFGLSLTPGPTGLLALTHGALYGHRRALWTIGGGMLGFVLLMALSMFGLAALLKASAHALLVLKWLGAAYLLWMGVRMLFSRAGGGNGAAIAAAQAAPQQAVSLRGVFLGGFWTNVLNPKVAIFFLAFVPQFIAPATENKALAFVLLGVLFNVNAIPVNALWALAASWMARRVGAVQKGMHWLDRVAGAMFIGFGLKLAFTDHPAV